MKKMIALILCVLMVCTQVAGLAVSKSDSFPLAEPVTYSVVMQQQGGSGSTESDVINQFDIMKMYAEDDVKQFRWREALFILEDTSCKIKEIKPEMEITVCVHATNNNYYVTEQRGYDDWDRVASCPYFDVFSTTIINWSLPRAFFEDITRRTVAVAHKYGKPAERWIMNYYNAPAKLEQMDEIVSLYESMGVDRLAAWTYRGGYGTVLAPQNALEMWDRLGENYHRVLK